MVGDGLRLPQTDLCQFYEFADVPRDFIEEEKDVSRIALLPRELCYLYDRPDVSKQFVLLYLRGVLCPSVGRTQDALEVNAEPEPFPSLLFSILGRCLDIWCD